jgi:hypothetical protein
VSWLLLVPPENTGLSWSCRYSVWPKAPVAATRTAAAASATRPGRYTPCRPSPPATFQGSRRHARPRPPPFLASCQGVRIPAHSRGLPPAGTLPGNVRGDAGSREDPRGRGVERATAVPRTHVDANRVASPALQESALRSVVHARSRWRQIHALAQQGRVKTRHRSDAPANAWLSSSLGEHAAPPPRGGRTPQLGRWRPGRPACPRLASGLHSPRSPVQEAWRHLRAVARLVSLGPQPPRRARRSPPRHGGENASDRSAAELSVIRDSVLVRRAGSSARR